MKKFNASQLYPFHPTSELLAAFLALPEPVGAAFALAWWEEDGQKVDVALYALRGREGVEVDWEAVVGPPAADFARLLEAWMRDTREEERMEAWLSRGGGNAQLVYTALPRGELDRVEVVWVWSELPPEPPPLPERVWSYERALEERVDHALRRYRTFYAREAPGWFREAYPQEPTLPGVLALGKLKGYWDPTEEEAAARISRAHLG